MADTPPLPEGARLALLHWPRGTPTWREISAAARQNTLSPRRGYALYVKPLIDAGMIELLSDNHRFRLTPAGRRALDDVQSGDAQ